MGESPQAASKDIDDLLAAVGAGRLTRQDGITRLRSLGATFAKQHQSDGAARTWLAVARALLESGEHAQARRALDTARVWLARGKPDATLRSDSLFIEGELFRAKGALKDAVNLCLRHIADPGLSGAPNYFRAFQTLVACYIDNGEYLLAAQYSERIRERFFDDGDSWKSWPFLALEMGAYLSLAQASHPVNNDLIVPVIRGAAIGVPREVWLERARVLAVRAVPDAAWSLAHAPWEIDRRISILARLNASRLAQSGDPKDWEAAHELVRASLACNEPRMAMVVGMGLCQSMIGSGAASEAILLLEAVRNQWLSDKGADPMVFNVHYLLSKAYRAVGRHEQAHSSFREYACSAFARLEPNPSLPFLPQACLGEGPGDPGRRPAADRPGRPHYLQAALDAIEQDSLGKAPGVQELADQVGVSPRTLLSAFRLHLGVNPSQYLEQVRLARAHHLLAEVCLSVTVADVAVQCGFAHLGRFARAYRVRYGFSPSEHLRNCRAALNDRSADK